MSDIRPLPERPSVEFERKAAKALLRQLRAGNPEALQRAQSHERSLTSETLPELKLADAQRIIAREYGFTSWTRLVQYFGDVQRQRYEHLNTSGWIRGLDPAASLRRQVQQLLRAHSTREEFAGRLLAAYVPQLYGQTVEDVFSHSIAESDAQLALARFEGFSSWTALLEASAAVEQLLNVDPWHVDEWSDASAAIKTQDLPALERVISAHPGILERETDSGLGVQELLRIALSPIELDVNRSISPVVHWLVARGANVTPLLNQGLFLGTGARAHYVQQLLDLGADPNWVMPNGRPVLEHALIAWSNGEAVDVLAARAKRRDVLWIAAGLGDVAGVARWLDANGKPRAAARRDRPDFSSLVGQRRPQLPDASDDELLREVFWVAMSNDRGDVLEYLVQRGFDVNSRVFDVPFVVMAVDNGCPNAVQALVRSGADVSLASGNVGSAREVAQSNWLRRQTAAHRRMAELVGLDADALLAEQRAVPAPEPVLDERMKESLQLASDDARRTGAAVIELEHLFIGLLRARNVMQQTVRHSGRINVREFLNVFGDRLLPHDQRLSEPPLEHSSEVEQAMRDATAHARAERRAQQSSAHLLTVLVRDDHAPIAKLLSRFGANLALLRQQL